MSNFPTLCLMDRHMLTLPNHSRLICAFGLAVLFAIPFVTIASFLAVFPIFVFGVLAVFVNAGPLVLLVVYGLDRVGLRRLSQGLCHNWILSAIVLSGCAFGYSNVGSVGGSIGANNMPYFEVFFSPVLLLWGYPIG